MTSPNNDALHLEIGFDEALARIAQTDPGEIAAQSDTRSAPGIDSIEALIDQFENAGQSASGGEKFWYGRELALLLGYDKWERFHNRGYQGLYGGRGTKEIRIHKRLHATAQILDHMGSTELAANLFRITQTEEKLRSGAVVGKEAACEAHYEVGRKVRQTMKELSGIMPEDLPVADDVKKIAAQERKLQRVRAIPPAQRIAEPLAGPKQTDPVEIDLRRDLWKYALLIMSVEPGGEIATSTLIDRMPEYIHLSDDHLASNASRKDSKFSQIVRNLKSHKQTKTNFIFQGYAEDIRGGFKITAKGIAFVKEYFSK